MKNSKRIFAGVLACVSVFSFVGCGSKDDESSYTATLNEEQSAVIDDITALLPDVTLENTTVKWLAHYDINPAEGKAMPPSMALFQTKYNGKVQWIQSTWDTRYTDLATSITGNQAPDIFPADDMDTFPKGAIKNMFQPIDQYVDLEADFWEGINDANDKFMYKGDHYVAVIDIVPNIICVYNRNTISEMGYDDPADLYAEGKWDWNTFKEMCINFVNEEEDRYALDGWGVENAIMTSAGVPLIDMVDGEIVSNLMDPTIEKVQNFMYELQKDTVLYPRHLINNWSIRGGDTGIGIGTGLTLFCPTGLWDIEDKLENTSMFGAVDEGEVMFVPMPKDPDLDYYPIWSRVNGYMIVEGASNPEGAAAYINCCRVSADSEETNKIGDDQLMNEYGWTQEMIDMKHSITDMARANPLFDFSAGVSDKVAGRCDQLSRGTMIPGEQTWAEIRSSQSEALNAFLAEAIQEANA